ncbi:hypothetical protein DRP44_07820 [candidate division TA06 bacterium]|uniref:Tetratricopeptide repeat protein n=1 Tax=candidate division TA06 bacterium TaxID=2250710 RepID=A0A660S7C9_UNCT6|nr:MAG: hypothetical protein DRP44_07820 [candidate division TA06 bacterium]
MVKRMIFFALVILFAGCSLFKNNISEGWKSFESGDYQTAKNDFYNAISSGGELEAYVGYGWSCAKLGDESKALSSFEYVLASDSMGFPDAVSGAVFAGNAMKIDSVAARRGEYLLNMLPDYVFEHDSTITWKQIAFTSACSFVNCNDFSSALDMIRLIEPNFNASFMTESGIDSILTELDEISRWI